MIEHPQVKASASIVEVDHPAAGRLRQRAHRQVRAHAVSGDGAPLLGEHNDEVLSELGYSESTRSELRAGKIIGSEAYRNKDERAQHEEHSGGWGRSRHRHTIYKQLDARGDSVIAACLGG